MLSISFSVCQENVNFVFINCQIYDKMNDNSVAMEILYVVCDIVILIDI